MRWRLALFLSVYYAANAVYQGYITVYLGASGLNARQIGLTMGLVPLLSMVTQPAWGALGDRVRRRERLLLVMALGSAAAMLLLPAKGGFVWMLCLNALFAASFTAIQPMSDSVILTALGRRGALGPIRLCASVAFAFSSLLAGQVLRARLDLLSPVTAGLLVLAAFSALLLPATPGAAREKRKKRIWEVFQLPGMASLLALTALLQMTMGYYYSFFPVYFVGLPGADEQLLGVSYLIASASEIPFLLLCDRLFDRLGAGKLLLGSAMALSARWLLLGISGRLLPVMLSQVLHGWGFIVLTVTMAKQISRQVPDALRARGQALLSVVGYGLARVAGNLLGGTLAGGLGIQAGFLVMAGLLLVSVIAFGPALLARKR